MKTYAAWTATAVLIGSLGVVAFAARPSPQDGKDHLCHAPVSPMTEVRSVADHPVADEPNVPDDAPALIGVLVTRRHSVSVYAGLRYSVADADGVKLATLITDADLRAQLPGLFHDLENALAHSTTWAGE